MAYNANLYNPYTWSQPSWAYNPQAITQQPVNGLVSVTGIEGAKAYQLPPNSSIALFDKDDDFMYVKTTDSAGYPTIRTFRFQPEEPIEVEPVKDYVPRSEFDAFVAEVKELLDKPKATHARKDGDGE